MKQKTYTVYFECLLVTLFLLVGFVPYLNALDKIAPQYVYLVALNAISSVYILFTSKTIRFKNAGYVVASMTLLVIWSLISLFYAINKAEVLIDNSRIVIFFFVFVNLFLLIKRNKILIKYIPYLISAILFIELFLVYERFFSRYTGETYTRDMGLRAFSGNINIAAFNFLMKFPFLLNVLSRIKKYQLLKISILSAFIFCLFLLGSRGANLFFFFMILLIVLSFVFFKQKTFIGKKDFIIIFLSLVIGILLNSFVFQENKSLNVVQRSTNLDTSSTQQRIRFYKAALNSILENPIIGVGLGNWKIHATEYDKPFMKDYTVPYHVHNDFLEIFAEIGIIGFILYYGIFLWIFILLFKKIKTKNHKEDKNFNLLIIASLSSLVYLADSFLNFPFTRPLIQTQNFFYLALILILLENSEKINFNFLNINYDSFSKKSIYFLIIISGVFYSGIISYKVFQSYLDQQFLKAAGSGTLSNYSRQYVESIQSEIPSIDATTVPIETLKANLIYNIKDYEYNDDTLHYMISQGRKQNPFLPYNDLTKSVLYIKQRKPDSAYLFAKKAFYEIPNHNVHFELLMDIAEAYKDSIEVNKAMNTLVGDVRESFYKKYLEVSLNIKNNLGLTESKFLEKYNSKNPENETAKVFNIIFEVGKKNVEDAYFQSMEGVKFFNKKDFNRAAEYFSKAYNLNPKEVSYYENAANSYMQAGEDKKAIEILEKLIKNLNPKTGKAEYLLAIINIGLEKNEIGCKYLIKSEGKGFSVPKAIFERFCN